MMTAPTFTVIAALDSDRGIGKDGGIPWRLPEDIKRFKEVTTAAPAGMRNAVIMGRKTYESIPRKFRPLAGRHNVVMTSNLSLAVERDVAVARNLDAAIDMATSQTELHKIFVIGGGEIYRQAIEHPSCAALDLTLIDQRFGCDTFFPESAPGFLRTNLSATLYDGELSFAYATFRRAT